MKLGVSFGILMVVSFAKNVDCRGFSLEAMTDFIFPHNPEVHRVRRMEDADGDPDAVLDTVGLVEQYGYPAEEHKVTTDDGYNLVFFRVPGSPKSPPARGKPAVFIQHGTFASSDTWVFLGPGQSIAFTLADAGYDVWMGNIRGNTYCRSHVNLTTADPAFWDHSWHEMGIYDIPKMIDYILDLVGQKTLLYIGHSMGTTVTYVMLTERPEYNAKMRLVISLAPAGSWKYMPSLMYRLISQYGAILKNLADSLEVYDIGPQTKTNAMLIESLCGPDKVTLPLCVTGIVMGVGQPHVPMNMTLMTYLGKYCPAGASVKTLIHYQQCFSHIIQKYDYGPSENKRRYGSKKPPRYDLSKATAPFALIYGNTDQLGLQKNVLTVSQNLPNVVTMEAVPARIFNHLDFVISPMANELVYKRVVQLLDKYSK